MKEHFFSFLLTDKRCPALETRTDLHLDGSHESFVPPVHPVRQVLARDASKGIWRPLEVSGGSERGQSLPDLLQRLEGNETRSFEMNCESTKTQTERLVSATSSPGFSD